MSGEEPASRRASTGTGGNKGVPTRTGQALMSNLGALSAGVGGGGGVGGLPFGDKKAGGGPVSKFSAAKLVSVVQETSAPSIARVRKNTGDFADHSKKYGDEAPAIGDEMAADSSRRRIPARSFSAQNPRTNSRKLKASEHDLGSSPLMRGEHDDDSLTMDRSNASTASGRRRLPQRSKSGDLQRPPRVGRRRPEKVDEDDSSSPISPRRTRPTRAMSAEEMPRTYQQRRPRTGRRRPGREEDSDNDGVNYSGAEESVEISDSEFEAEKADMDRSTVSHGGRRRTPARSKSVQDERYERAERRRARRRGTNGEGYEDDGSPKRGLGLQRSSTGDVPARGPALRRTNTGEGPGPRSARSRGARNTAAELAVVASLERERQERDYSPESPVAERVAHGAKGSVSPIKSREERRRLREAKEREGMERRMTMGSAMIPEKPRKKEEPWMRRRLQKASGADDSFTFDDAFSASDGFTSNHDSGGMGSNDPKFHNSDDFFQDRGFTQSTAPAIPKLDKPPR